MTDAGESGGGPVGVGTRFRGGRWSIVVAAVLATGLCGLVVLRGGEGVQLVAVLGLALLYAGLATRRGAHIWIGGSVVLATAVAVTRSTAGVGIVGIVGLLSLSAGHLGVGVRRAAGPDAATGRAERTLLAGVAALLVGTAVVWGIAVSVSTAIGPGPSMQLGLFGGGILAVVVVVMVRI